MSISETDKPRRADFFPSATRPWWHGNQPTKAFQRYAACPKPKGERQRVRSIAGRDLPQLAGNLGSRERRALRMLAEGAYDVVDVQDADGRRHQFLVALAYPLVLNVLAEFEMDLADIEPDADDDLEHDGAEHAYAEPIDGEQNLDPGALGEDAETDAVEQIDQRNRTQGDGCDSDESHDGREPDVDAEPDVDLEPSVPPAPATLARLKAHHEANPPPLPVMQGDGFYRVDTSWNFWTARGWVPTRPTVRP